MLSSLKGVFTRERVKHYGETSEDPPTADSAIECGEDDEFGFTVINTLHHDVLVKTQPLERVEAFTHCSSSATVALEVSHDATEISSRFQAASLDSSLDEEVKLESQEWSNFMKVSDVPVWLPPHMALAMEVKYMTSQQFPVNHLILDMSQFKYNFSLEKQLLASMHAR
jgi:hypothetical protein